MSPRRFLGRGRGSTTAHPDGPAVRLSISLPPPVARWLEDEALRSGRSRSAVIAEALEAAQAGAES